MPSSEEVAKFMNRKEAPGWNGPKGDPNWSVDGQWTGKVPDTDTPMPSFRADIQDLDQAFKFAGKARTFAIDADGQPERMSPEAYDGWKTAFTSRVARLGLVVMYGDRGINIYNEGATANAPLYIHRSPDAAESWLLTEESKRGLERAEAERKAQAMQEATEALHGPGNPAALPDIIKTLQDRIDVLEAKLNG